MIATNRRLVLAVSGDMAVNVLLLPHLAGLRSAGWEVHVVCAPGPVSSDVRRLVTDVHFVPMSRAISPARDMRSIAAMVRLLRRIRPIAVVGSTPKASVVSMIGARLAGVPVRVFQVRGARWDGGVGRRASLMKLADRVAARAATDVIAVSPSLADLLIVEGITPRPAVVLGSGGSMGVDTVEFHPDAGRVYDPVSPVIGFAGRLTVDKGIAELVDVVARVREWAPRLTVQIIGDVDDTQPIPDALVRELRSTDGLSWVGAVRRSEMPALMRTWDLLLFPSRREGLPNVVIEAAATGVPTVAWRVTGVVDAIDDPDTGRLVPFGDVTAMAAAVRECLEPSRHAAMCANARAWAVSNFDGDAVRGSFADFLRDACRRRG